MFIFYCCSIAGRIPFKVTFLLLQRRTWNFKNPYSVRSVCLAKTAALSNLPAKGTLRSSFPVLGSLRSPLPWSARLMSSASWAGHWLFRLPRLAGRGDGEGAASRNRGGNTERTTSEQKPRRKQGTKRFLIYYSEIFLSDWIVANVQR